MKVLVIGGGIAGQAVLEAIRERDTDIELTLACAEPRLPYDRVASPPSSPTARTPTRSRCAPRAGSRTTTSRSCSTRGSRRSTGYDRYVVCTGSDALVPPIPGAQHAHVFRGPEDCAAITAAPAAQGRRDRRRPARPRSGRGLAELGLRDDGGAPHGPADGAPARRRRAPSCLAPAMEDLGVTVLLNRTTEEITARRRAAGGRGGAARRPGGHLGRHPAAGGPRARRRADRGARDRRGRRHGDLRPPRARRRRVRAAPRRRPRHRRADPRAGEGGRGHDLRLPGHLHRLHPHREAQGHGRGPRDRGRARRRPRRRRRGRLHLPQADRRRRRPARSARSCSATPWRRAADGRHARCEAPDRSRCLAEASQATAADLPDSARVCNCHGVCKGEIVSAIREGGLGSTLEVVNVTRAGAGCGSCKPMVAELLANERGGAAEEATFLCPCRRQTREELAAVVRERELDSRLRAERRLRRRPRLRAPASRASPTSSARSRGNRHREERHARYINDRVHANIQNDGTFSVGPAHPRRRHERGRAAPDRRRRGQVRGPADQDHRRPADRPAGHQEGAAPGDLGGARTCRPGTRTRRRCARSRRASAPRSAASGSATR